MSIRRWQAAAGAAAVAMTAALAVAVPAAVSAQTTAAAAHASHSKAANTAAPARRMHYHGRTYVPAPAGSNCAPGHIVYSIQPSAPSSLKAWWSSNGCNQQASTWNLTVKKTSFYSSWETTAGVVATTQHTSLAMQTATIRYRDGPAQQMHCKDVWPHEGAWGNC